MAIAAIFRVFRLALTIRFHKICPVCFLCADSERSASFLTRYRQLRSTFCRVRTVLRSALEILFQSRGTAKINFIFLHEPTRAAYDMDGENSVQNVLNLYTTTNYILKLKYPPEWLASTTNVIYRFDFSATIVRENKHTRLTVPRI